jgi:Na+-transporting NADH:ubiquinone oxidoreductase subunit B
VPVDGFTGATALSVSASQGFQALSTVGLSWWDAFFGFMDGCIGETSAFCALLGGIFLVYTRIANYRLIAGCLIGTALMSSLFNLIGSDSNPMFAMPWYWHIVLGGYAFGLVYMVTEPVSAAHTNLGRWWYGGLIGGMCVLIRVVNPAFPEGMMLAILFGNVFAPLIDFFVVKANVRRRQKRHA